MKPLLGRVLERVGGVSHPKPVVRPDIPHGIVHEIPGKLLVMRMGDELQLLFPTKNPKEFELQGRMNLADPLELPSPYMQAMMLALCWNANIEEDGYHALFLGLGAGRMQSVMKHHMPNAYVCTVEKDKIVYDVAVNNFGFSGSTILQDARGFIDNQGLLAHVVFIDVFDGTKESPFNLSTVEFYASLKKQSRPGVVVCVNLMSTDSLQNEKLATMAQSFTHCYAVNLETNGVMFGTDANYLPTDILISRAVRLEKKYGFHLPLTSWAKRVIRVLPTDKPPLTDADAEWCAEPDSPPLVAPVVMGE